MLTLYQARKRAKLNPEYIASCINCSMEQYYKYENEETDISSDTAGKIFNLLRKAKIYDDLKVCNYISELCYKKHSRKR